MPSRNRHREKMRAMQANGNWANMLADQHARARLLRDRPAVVVALDYLAGKREVYQERGWTAFNDWLDLAYTKHFDKRPESVPFVSLDAIRVAVFPNCK